MSICLWTGLTRILALALCMGATLAPCESRPQADPPNEREASVGISARIQEVVLPGSELEILPSEDRSRPIVLRITDVYPHGDSFRYHFEYYGLVPGTWDLTDYMRHKDGSPTDDLPPLEVTIRSVLPPERLEPHRLEAESPGSVGGYTTWLVVLGIAWLLGLIAILRLGRKQTVEDTGVPSQRPLTFADRLKPLVEEAMRGELPKERRAALERMLLVHWRKRLELQDVSPAEGLRQLRAHPEAGELLRQMENWLHRPDPPESVDLATLLEPYRHLPAEPEEVL
ncbi:MAG: hypothetical protein RL885_17495 [Planctomycetota bacterium]